MINMEIFPSKAFPLYNNLSMILLINMILIWHAN